MAAASTQSATGFPEDTECMLTNSTDEALKLGPADQCKMIWYGSQLKDEDIPKEINPNGGTAQFIHKASTGSGDEILGTAGGLMYVNQANKYKWIIAWSNLKKQPKKVYTKILLEDERVKWEEIQKTLDNSSEHSQYVQSPYTSDINIQPTKTKATATSKLTKADVRAQA